MFRIARQLEPEQNCGAMRRAVILQAMNYVIYPIDYACRVCVTDMPLSIMYTEPCKALTFIRQVLFLLIFGC